MKRKKKPIGNKKERVIISDVLPYEIPVTFANRYLFDFLTGNKIEIEGNAITWEKGEPVLKEIIKLLFGVNGKEIKSQTHEKIVFKENKPPLRTIPFSYKISHKGRDFRELTIIHPKNQLALIEFYEKYKELILYYCSISPFSIRKPDKIAKFTYHKDKAHFENFAHEHEHSTVEEFDKEYEHLKTFFVYKNYSNIHKFYESYKFHRSEKKYNKLLKFDISKCFDSIYSHSISWALLNKGIVKDKIGSSNKTFGGKFDALMQDLNYGETNGIIIGPEFSRIFAEIILQQIDLTVLHLLKEQEPERIHKKDYEIFRYVDDYFVFYNDERAKEDILQTYRLQLKEYKLYVSDLKTIEFDKPIITGITRAKLKISDLLNENLNFKVKEKEVADSEIKEKTEKRYSFYISSNKLITRFKAIIKNTDIAYEDILNYTLACIDRKVLKLIDNYSEIENKAEQERKVCKAILEILDFTFFLYAVSPKVNTTIKLCMILSKLIKFSKIKGNFNHDNKHLIFKGVYDGISQVLQKNKSSEYTQVETLYLLIALNELGKEYRLVEKLLCSYCDINLENMKCKHNLNYFTIVVLLFYIGDKVRYDKLRQILHAHIFEKFEKVEEINRGKTTELTILLFDLLACPYLEEEFKKKLLSLYKIKDALHTDIINKRKFWFTKWTDFDFRKALEAKKSQEVY